MQKLYVSFGFVCYGDDACGANACEIWIISSMQKNG